MENPQYSFKNRIVLFTTRIPPPHPQLNEVLLTLTASNIELTIVHLPSCEPPSLIGTSFQSSTLLVPASTNQFTSLLSFSTLLADHPSVSLLSLTSSTNLRHRLAALFDSYLVEILGEKKPSGNPVLSILSEAFGQQPAICADERTARVPGGWRDAVHAE
ncbi:hypothetical protein BLNAU_8193 [Blattamonas nauphoetae]|uniref:Uncharacterized protein n=1 Tax=Blattamonas nauphoetae TaxID=2049346 RepID=A0ABQ9XZK8_9EUKA|nr:hypothetical protein BLNAU_8193 [Blattamonas nauphoetae]